MSNDARLAYENLVDPSGVTLAISSGTGTDTYSLQNLKIRQLSTIWRRTGIPSAGTTVIRLTGITNCKASVFNHLLALIDFRWGTNEAQVANKNNVFSIFPTITVTGKLSGTTKITKSFPLIDYTNSRISELPFNYYLKIEPTDYSGLGTNIDELLITIVNGTGATALQMGRLWFGPSLLFNKGCDINWDLLHTDTGVLLSSQSNQWYENRKIRSRRSSCGLSNMDATTAYGFAEGALPIDEYPNQPSLQKAAYYMGLTSEGIWLPRTSTDLWMHRMGVYGHMASPIKITQVQGGLYSSAIEMIEES